MGYSIAERMKERARRSGKPTGVVSSFSDKAVVETDSGKRDIIATATTDDIDSVFEVVVPEGVSRLSDKSKTIKYFGENKQIFTDHCTGLDDWIGQARAISPLMGDGGRQRGWTVRYQVRNTQTGNDLLVAVSEGMMPGHSIGFEALDHGPPTEEEVKRFSKGGISPGAVVRAWTWLELSVTAMPCNVACQGSLPSSLDDERSQRSFGLLDNLVTKGRIKRESAYAFGLADARRRTIVLIGM